MDNTTPIVPSFDGKLERSAATLGDFFLISAENQVQVTRVTILVDGEKHKFVVGAGKYKSTLFLLYCAVLKGSTTFSFDADLRTKLAPYFGTGLVDQARLPETGHVTLRHLVIGQSVEVNLVLKPGYELPKGPGRTVRKLIEHAWSRHDTGTLFQDSPVPLIRQAIEAFRQAEHDGTIRVVHSWDPKIWPSDKWAARVGLLAQGLGMPKKR